MTWKLKGIEQVFSAICKEPLRDKAKHEIKDLELRPHIICAFGRSVITVLMGNCKVKSYVFLNSSDFNCIIRESLWSSVHSGVNPIKNATRLNSLKA